MIAYRIDADLSITRVEDADAEMNARDWDWSCLDYDDANDVWSNDWGLTESGLTLAWIGRARRVPLPAYVRGADGEDSCDPHLAIDEVRFGKEGDQSRWPLRVEPSGRVVIAHAPDDPHENGGS